MTWFAIPVAFYSPETRLGYGGTGALHFAFAPALQTSDVQVIAVGTERSQAILDLRTQLFPSEHLAVGATLKLAHYPDLFYGIGPATPRGAREEFTDRSLEVLLTSEWFLVPGRLRTGPRLWLRREQVVDVPPGGALAGGGVTGAGGAAATGLGWSATWDSRYSRFAPSAGGLVEASHVVAPGAFGSRLHFGRGALDAKRFLRLGGAVVLGLATHLEWVHGTVPFTLLPRLGGDQNLRGFYEGRWRDRELASAQAELRSPIAGRLGGVVFAGLAAVAPRLGAFEASPLRVAAGLGARYRITEDGLNLRLDVGLGQEGAAVYFNLGEAF